jgi:hypothetical protein
LDYHITLSLSFHNNLRLATALVFGKGTKNTFFTRPASMRRRAMKANNVNFITIISNCGRVVSYNGAAAQITYI